VPNLTMKIKEWIMKLTLMLAVALMGATLAHADVVKPGPGFDRVGMASGETLRVAHERNHWRGKSEIMPLEVRDSAYAPGESSPRAASGYQARKAEMARRLVWLMLSAR
jgi:hypothetical protein